jgi:hypothetical protein
MDSESADIIWGGESANEAVEWFRRTPNAKVQVSVWNTQSEEDFHLVDNPIEVTQLIMATLACEPFNPKTDKFRKLRLLR